MHSRYWRPSIMTHPGNPPSGMSTRLALQLLHGLFVLLPLAVQFPLAHLLGSAGFYLLRRRRHIAKVNIALCLPELDATRQRRLLQDNFRATARGIVELAISWWASDDTVRRLSRLEGRELLVAARQQQRGVLLIGAHYTSIDLAGRVIGLHEDLDITYKRQRNPVFDVYLGQRRQRSFRHLIEKNDMRQMIRQLQAGRTVWFAPDQDFGRKGSVFAPFFHRDAATIGNIGRILSLTGARPLFYSHFRETGHDGKAVYVGRISDPFHDGFGDDAVANATLLNQAIADVIRQHPEQYLWVHERFRTQPEPGMAKPYRLRKKKHRATKEAS